MKRERTTNRKEKRISCRVFCRRQKVPQHTCSTSRSSSLSLSLSPYISLSLALSISCVCVCVLAASVRASFHHHHLRHHRLIIAAITISPPSFDIFDNKILTEASKAPLRAVALASFLGDGFAALGSRAPPVKDLMAFGAVLHTNQHNIGKSKSIFHCTR